MFYLLLLFYESQINSNLVCSHVNCQHTLVNFDCRSLWFIRALNLYSTIPILTSFMDNLWVRFNITITLFRCKCQSMPFFILCSTFPIIMTSFLDVRPRLRSNTTITLFRFKMSKSVIIDFNFGLWPLFHHSHSVAIYGRP